MKTHTQSTHPPFIMAALLWALVQSPSADPLLAQDSQTDGPSEKDTIEWIQSHLAQLGNSSSEQVYRSHFHYTKAEVQDEKLILTRTSEDRRFGVCLEMERIGINLRNMRAVSLHTNWAPGSFELHFTTVNSGVHVDRGCYVEYNDLISLNGRDIPHRLNDPLNDLRVGIEQRVLMPLSQEPDGIRGSGGAGRAPAGSWRQSEWATVVADEDAGRFKKAFDHLIKLHGGGKPEAF
jgi:hypothetical protein